MARVKHLSVIARLSMPSMRRKRRKPSHSSLVFFGVMALRAVAAKTGRTAVLSARPLAFRVLKRFIAVQRDEVLSRVKDILNNFDKVDPSKVHEDAHLHNDLGLDSLDGVEVVMAVEDEFSVDIPDAEAEALQTVKDFVDIVLSKSQEE